MRLPFFIAYRYLFSKKKINAINIITAIAMLGFGVGAFAMIIVLSTLNGFENIMESMLNQYDPDIKISQEGKKTFAYSDSLKHTIEFATGVTNVSKTLEEKVVLKYDGHQEIARIKGVDQNFSKEKFDSLIVIGNFNLGDSSSHLGVFGGGLSSRLNLFPGSPELVTVFVPKRDVEYNALNPLAALSTKYLRAGGVFIVNEEIDNEVFITSLDFAQNLLDYPASISALEVRIAKDVSPLKVQKTLQNALGPQWNIKTRRELNELIYKVFSSEKWFTFAILFLVLVISSFNIFGSLVMLVLDKKKDIGVLKSMGCDESVIRKIFIWQGSYIAIFGGGMGILLASILVYSQEVFGWFTMENNFVDAYPAELLIRDVVLTFAVVALLGYLISLYPAYKASKTEIKNLN